MVNKKDHTQKQGTAFFLRMQATPSPQRPEPAYVCPIPPRRVEQDPFSGDEMLNAIKWMTELQDKLGDRMPALKILFAASLDERLNGEFARVILSVTQKKTIRVCPQETPSSATGASIVLGAAMPIWAIVVLPSARTEDIGAILDRVVLSQRE